MKRTAYRCDEFLTLDSAERKISSIVAKLLGAGRVWLYVLVDPRDETVRYVGVTSNPHRRAKQHASGHTANRAMRAWVMELAATGDTPVLWTLGRCARGKWESAERRTIRNLRRSARLYNIEGGGRRLEGKPAERRARRERREMRAEHTEAMQARRLRSAERKEAERIRVEKIAAEMLRKPQPPLRKLLPFDESEDIFQRRTT